jgi:hypothetical protein
MFRVYFLILISFLSLSGCQWWKEQTEDTTYQIQGISAYKGQNAADLFNNNGAPNQVKQIGNNAVIWIYDTNYQPVGGGELISFNVPNNPAPNATNCQVKIVLVNNLVQQVISNCQQN